MDLVPAVLSVPALLAAVSVVSAVLVVSTDHSELTRLAERILVLQGGRITEELRRPHIDPDRITAATIGAGQGAAA